MNFIARVLFVCAIVFCSLAFYLSIVAFHNMQHELLIFPLFFSIIFDFFLFTVNILYMKFHRMM